MEAITPALEVKVWGSERVLTFATTSDVIRWAELEEQRWADFKSPQNPRLGRLLTQQRNNTAGIKSAAQAPDPRPALTKAFAPISAGTILTSDSPYFPAALAVGAQDGDGGLLGVLGARSDGLTTITNSGVPIDLVIRFAVLVGPLAQLERGKNVESTASDLTRLKNQFDSGLAELRVSQAKFDAEIAKSAKSLKQQEADRHANWAQEMDGVRSDWGKLKAVYDTELGLRAPTTYWTERGGSHKRQAIGYGICFSLAILVLIGVFSKLGLSYLSGVSDDRSAVIAVLPVLIPAFAGIWILRILGRLLSESLQLMRDARERETLVKTFLALMKDEVAGKSVIRDEDRSLILHSLFRQSAITASDDAPPVHWLDALANKAGHRR